MLYDQNRQGDDLAAAALRRTGFHADVQPMGESTVVQLQGELDMAASPMFSRALSGALSGGARHLVVDLTGLTFMDSTGISVLLKGCRQAEATGGSLVVRSPRRAVLKAIRLTGVDRVLGIESEEFLTS